MANQITKVYLLNVPLESDLKNTLYFTSASNQQSYFQSRIQKSYTDFSYQRKDQFIRVPAQFDTLYNCNYVMYQNSAYSNKWFYAFITKMEYVDDGRTDIYIETDVMQTWMFDITVKASFVEREHVNDDTVGLHTVPEQIETGEYISCNLQPSDKFSFGYSNCVIVLAVTEGIDDLASVTTFNQRIPSGLIYVGIKSQTALRGILEAYANAGKADAVSSVFIAPEDFFNNFTDKSVGGNTYNVSTSTVYELSESTTITKPPYLGQNYQPRNKKLLTFPYTFLQASNNAGAIVNYRWEDFYNVVDPSATQTITFNLIATISPGCDMRVYPSNYKNMINNYDESISMGKLPVGSWASDVYTNWLTQNGINIAVGFGTNVAQIIGGVAGVASGGGAGLGVASIASGLTGIASSVGQVYQHSFQPPQAEGNINCGDVNYMYNLTNITFKRMSIKNEYASIIDGYFDMFGYKVNMVKVPNKAHRSRWWYTKTIDVNIDGAVPNEDMQKIKNAYNSGITFWRNASEIQNYSLSNNIV